MKLYLVQAENGGEPEFYTLGLFETREQAEALVEKCLYSPEREDAAYDEGVELYEYVWVEKMGLNTEVRLCNR